MHEIYHIRAHEVRISLVDILITEKKIIRRKSGFVTNHFS